MRTDGQIIESISEIQGGAEVRSSAQVEAMGGTPTSAGVGTSGDRPLPDPESRARREHLCWNGRPGLTGEA